MILKYVTPIALLEVTTLVAPDIYPPINDKNCPSLKYNDDVLGVTFASDVMLCDLQSNCQVLPGVALGWIVNIASVGFSNIRPIKPPSSPNRTPFVGYCAANGSSSPLIYVPSMKIKSSPIRLNLNR
jgi:hypothetical protein